ncbi:unnamed protein product [Allacma fusca]|uniref:Uncharacterized protein n=1 Tax=Allacma fusca TaxID=39272 RepID=A0A8J2JU08_9HEXA|nr:unnamed protein product [Allacma fusca]
MLQSTKIRGNRDSRTVSTANLGSNNGSYDLQLGKQRCPAGILFKNPVVLVVRGNVSNGYCTSDDICSHTDTEILRCDNFDRILKAQYLPGSLVIRQDPEIITDVKNDIHFEVNHSQIQQGGGSRVKRTVPGEMHIKTNNTANRDLIEETKQLFFFMTDINSMDTAPDLEISKLLGEVFDVILKRCDPDNLEPLFTRAVHKGFLWLLTTYGTSGITDIPGETARRLKRTLQHCANDPRTIKVHGLNCLQQVTAVSIEMPNVIGEAAKEYRCDDKHAFQWGLYDPIVDAVWLSIDTVHALCSKYLEREGLIHEFAINMIKLLQIGHMGKRWITPIPLLQQDVYDRVFLAPVNESVRILDACNVGGTIISPFGRSKRPLPKVVKKQKILHRRSIQDDHSNTESPQMIYCLQTEQEKQIRLNGLRKLSKYGVLLQNPIDLVATEDFKNDVFCVKEDLCTPWSTVCGRKSQIYTGQLLTGNFTVTPDYQVLENADVDFDICQRSRFSRKIISRKKRTAPGETNIIVNETATVDQIDTTRRCDPSRLDPMFTNFTHKAFLWLIKQAAEGPPGGDIPQDEIQRIAGALDECGMKTNKPIRIVGPDCMENITHVVLEQEGIEGAWEYIYDDKVFKWGKYDPIVDAVWLAIDALHGLCEHELANWGVTHAYETYMLRLLSPALIETRWRTPTPLFRQEIFDHMLISPMNESVAILDACCVAGWKSSSYIARNVRPIDMKRRRKKIKNRLRVSDSSKLRRRRSATMGTNDMDYEKPSAYCLQSQHEREARLQEIRKIQC